MRSRSPQRLDVGAIRPGFVGWVDKPSVRDIMTPNAEYRSLARPPPLQSRLPMKNASVPEFSVRFDETNYGALDKLALLARQDYNLGGTGDWFGEFRGGLYGFYARLYGVEHHYLEVHAWRPCVRTRTDTEYHLASILFQMDSALECLIYALNAFGWVVMPTGFRDVTDAKALKRICPLDILGDSTKTPSIAPQPGYQAIFPTTQKGWQDNAQLIATVRDLHDVSKHRRTIFVGGQARSDPPNGFFDALGIPEDSDHRAAFWPMAEILLKDDPKTPAIHREKSLVRKGELLEELVPSFATFINTIGAVALRDAQTNVPLNEKCFRGQ